MRYLLALDQGTSSSRAMVFARDGSVCAMAQQPIRQIYPQPGWVEHDPLEIWASQRDCMRAALVQARISANEVAAIGITNQRETSLLWDKHTGEPIGHAIVWQDRRTEPLCAALREQGHASLITHKTGLTLDPYFSASKIRWMLDHIPDARRRADAATLAFGTVDTWLIWQLTGGARHVTDISNAFRTLLFNIHSGRWDEDLLALFDIPASILPEVLPSAAEFGHTDARLGLSLPIAGVAGDQQAALFGQGCHHAGQVKNTYGTGCFMLLHTGDRACQSAHGLITTRAAQLGMAPGFALEGSVFMGGALVQWLRDGLGLIASSDEIESLASSVPDTDGVVIVPAFTGLGAPYWRAEARGSILGLTRGTSRAHLARAALEAIAMQSTALLYAMQADTTRATGLSVGTVRVDGGACANNLLMQLQADLMGIPVCRPRQIETTALGAAWLAGLSSGLYASPDELASSLQVERTFEPTRSRDWAHAKMAAWALAVDRC